MFAAEVKCSPSSKKRTEERTHFLRVHQKLILKSKTKYFSKGSIIADSREPAKGLMVISSGFINAELPMDSDEADEENRDPNGKTLLYVFGRGYVSLLQTCIKIRVASVSC